MIKGLWGKKIGMTQVFSQDKVLPVTVIDVAGWYVVGIKTVARDGYNAMQVGWVRDRYNDQSFSADWLKKLKKHFKIVRELKIEGDIPTDITVGQPANFVEQFEPGSSVNVMGKTKGCGFAGVVRRHGFSGSGGSHGAAMGNTPGSLSFMRSQGRVIKGKKLPGHMGTLQRVMKNLTVVKVQPSDNIMLVKGSVPGKAGSLVFVRKA